MTLFIAAGAIVGGKRYLAVQSGFLRRGQYLRGWRAMWVIIDYKSQFGAEMTGGKKRWGNNPRLQYWEVAAVAAVALLFVCLQQSTTKPPIQGSIKRLQTATSLARLGQEDIN